jgi:predicted esterase
MEAQSHHIPVTRTARYYLLGEPGPHIRRVWYVLHGYGQLASFFIRHFTAIADETTLVVAPEALSRFYVDGVTGRVGATWMTKEDRLSEIEDYINFLDALLTRVNSALGQNVENVLLGFSQGTATAWRWMKHGAIQPRHLITWAGSVPKEADGLWAAKLGQTRLYTVVGDKDEYISTENADRMISAMRTLVPNLVDLRFSGEHRMDRETLLRLNTEINK